MAGGQNHTPGLGNVMKLSQLTPEASDKPLSFTFTCKMEAHIQAAALSAVSLALCTLTTSGHREPLALVPVG